MSGRRQTRLCVEIVVLPGGQTYTCGRHTHDRNSKCQQHRPPPKLKHPPNLLRPRQISLAGSSATMEEP